MHPHILLACHPQPLLLSHQRALKLLLLLLQASQDKAHPQPLLLRHQRALKLLLLLLLQVSQD
jgi:hypothetical protein